MMQNNLVGFMDKHAAAAFMDGLWGLLLSAQSTVGGVPAAVSGIRRDPLLLLFVVSLAIHLVAPALKSSSLRPKRRRYNLGQMADRNRCKIR